MEDVASALQARVLSKNIPKTCLGQSLKVNDAFKDVEKVDEHWYSGNLHEKKKIFQSSRVENIEKDIEGKKEKDALEFSIKEKMRKKIFEKTLYSFSSHSEPNNLEPPVPRLSIKQHFSFDAVEPKQHQLFVPRIFTSHIPNIIEFDPNIRAFPDQEKNDVELFSLFDEPVRHSILIGDAGSGKTTLTRIIARKSISKELGEFELVHILDNQIFISNEECTAVEALFSQFDFDDQKCLMTFAKDNGKRCLLIFDSLDTLPEELNEISDPISKYDPSKLNPSMVHLKMLLEGKLLGECRLITSSRSSCALNLKGDLKPKSMYFLKGFHLQSIKKFIDIYCEDSKIAECIYSVVTRIAVLNSLCRQPIFLLCITIIMRNTNPEEYESNGITKVLVDIMNNFLQTDHATVNYSAIGDKLKQLCLDNLQKHKFVFHERDLSESNLKPKDVSDLCSTKQASNFGVSLLKTNNPIIFSHQMFQEILAAIKISEYDYKDFVEKCASIHRSHFLKTRELLFGLLFGIERLQLRILSEEVTDVDMKKTYLKESITREFNSTASSFSKLSLVQTMAEAINAETKFTDLNVSEDINFSYIALTDWQCYCTGLFTAQFTFINQILLEYCRIDCSQIEALKVGLQKFPNDQLQITSFSLEGNLLDVQGISIACEIVTKYRTNAFNVAKCGLNTTTMEALEKGLNTTKLYKLVLAGNRLKESGMRIAGTIVKKCSVEDLDLSNCAKHRGEAEQFAKCAEGSAIYHLHVIDHNGDAVSGYGNVTSRCRLKTFSISLSALEEMDAEYFKRLAENREFSEKLAENGKVEELRVMDFVDLHVMRNRGKSSSDKDKKLLNTTSLLLPYVKERLIMQTTLSNFVSQRLETELNLLENKGPVIKFGTNKSSVIISKKRKFGEPNSEKDDTSMLEETTKSKIESLTESDVCTAATLFHQGGKVPRTDSVDELKRAFIKDQRHLEKSQDDENNLLPESGPNMIEETVNASNNNKRLLSTDDVIKLFNLEKEFLKLNCGSAVISWIQKHKDGNFDNMRKILEVHGLTIFEHDMSDDDCITIADTLVSCSPKCFRFSFSTGFPNLLEQLKANGLCKVEELCFDGWKEVKDSTAHQFIEFARLCSSSSLTLRSNGFDEVGLKSLKKYIEEMKAKIPSLKGLAINHEIFGTNSVECIAEIVELFEDGSLQLSLCDCGLDDARLLSLKDRLRGKKLSGLDISSNSDITEEGFATLGHIAKSSDLSSMTMGNCGLNVKKFDRFNKEAEGLSIRNLNLNNNPSIGKDGMEKMKLFIEDLKVESLDLSYCKLTNVDLNSPVHELDVSGNQRIRNFENIRSCVSGKLIIHNCMVTNAQMLSLSRGFREASTKLQEIDIGEQSKKANSRVLENVAKSLEETATALLIQFPGTHDLNCKILKDKLGKFQFGSIRLSPLFDVKETLD